MTPDEAVLAVQEALDRAAISWMIVGSLASNFHGVPRATRDADFVVSLGPGDIAKLADALPRTLHVSAQPAFETVTGTVRYVVELETSPFVCELFLLSDDAHDRERFERRRPVLMLGRQVSVATAEDTIVTKLRWAQEAGRSKDRDDIRNIVALRGSTLDWAYIERWSAVHRTTALLQVIRTDASF